MFSLDLSRFRVSANDGCSDLTELACGDIVNGKLDAMELSRDFQAFEFGRREWIICGTATPCGARVVTLRIIVNLSPRLRQRE